MRNLRPFQLVLLAASIAVFVGAIVLAALYRGTTEGPVLSKDIVIWGSLPSNEFNTLINAQKSKDDRFSLVTYKEIPEENFESAFVDALAEGRGPDLIVLPHDYLVTLRSKLYPITYDYYPQRTYQDSFIEGAGVFARNDGIYALPVAVDPLVMYWNRDLFTSNNFALPPETWEEVRNVVVPTLSISDSRFTLSQSAIAFGEYRNVHRAKEILSLLMLQSGSQMVYEANNQYQVALNSTGGETKTTPASTALQFYTTFANPNSALYSWNRSLPEDRRQFLSGDLALYFDYASAYDELLQSNPNLNIAMTLVPQGATAEVKRNYGRFYGIAIPRAAGSIGDSYAIATALSSTDTFAKTFSYAPVLRRSIAAGSIDPIQSVRYEAALSAFGWLEPAPATTDEIFSTMVEDVTSGRDDAGGAVNDAQSRIKLAL